jgi:hypothetical protein
MVDEHSQGSNFSAAVRVGEWREDSGRTLTKIGILVPLTG